MFTLRSLPFNPADLSGLSSESTFSFHYGKHHQTYVNNLNNLILNTDYQHSSLYDIIANSSGGIFNNAAQVFNHDFLWDCISAQKTQMSDNLKEAIIKNFGSLDKFKEEFINKATTLFGSGWTYLAFNPDTKALEIMQLGNASTPIENGKVPLLAVDVWEHAYYLDYQNARASWLNKFYDFINWDFVSSAYEWALKEGLGSTRFYIESLHAIKVSR